MMMRPSVPLCWLACLAGCAEGSSAGSSAAGPVVSSTSPSAPVTASVLAAPSPAAAAAPGPGCTGKPTGSHACDGARLLRCEASGPEEAQICAAPVERCDANQAKCVPACPKGEVYVPPTGPEGFTMGKDYMKAVAPEVVDVGKGHRTHTDVPHRVVLTKPFCMDALEVTVRQWKACMAAGHCEQPNTIRPFVTWPDQLDHPVNCVDWYAAKGYCEQRGKTLPSEAQWEWAATGGDGRTYPWGNDEPTCEHADYVPGVLPSAAGDAGCHGGGPSPVGTHPKGDRQWPGGAIHDLAGNVWEWTLDNYLPYKHERQVDPVHLTDESLAHSVRGGGWNRSHAGIRSAFRGGSRAGYQVPGLGFRCVRNPG